MKSIKELEAIRNRVLEQVSVRNNDDGKMRVVVGMATCGIAAGARPVMTSILNEVAKRNLSNVTVAQTGCIGMCRLEPIVEIYTGDNQKYTYVKMTADKAIRVVNDHLVNNAPVVEYLIGNED